MESDDLCKSIMPELGLQKAALSRSLLKQPRVRKMIEGEEKKARVRERLVSCDSDNDDDEPIGSLFKLKRPWNPKKVVSKVEANEVKLGVENEDFGGMEDTLASFRKKLKGPKKDFGSVISRPLQDGVERGYDLGDDVLGNTVDKKVGNVRKERVKKAKINVERVKNEGDGCNDLEALGSRDASSEDEKQGKFLSGEGSSESSDEKLEESLSVFLQKAQSGSVKKSCMNPSLKHNVRALELDNESISNCEGVSRAIEPVALRRPGSGSGAVCVKSKTAENQMINNGYCEDSNHMQENFDMIQDESMLDPCCSHRVCDENCSYSGQNCSLEAQTLKNGLKLCSMVKTSSLVHEKLPKQIDHIDGLGESKSTTDSMETSDLQFKDVSAACLSNTKPQTSDTSKGKEIGEVVEHENVLDYDQSPQASKFVSPKTRVTSNDCDVQNNHSVGLDNTSIPPQKELSAISNHEFPINQKCSSVLPENQLSDIVIKRTFVPNLDSLSINDDTSGASPCIIADENESYAEDAVSVPDSELKDTAQRAGRGKKRRLEDMAYEGDADWEVLINEQRFLENDQVLDNDKCLRVREKSDSSSLSATEAENGGTAAVAAGLKAHAAGPVEKIKFKEVLKRKGGLQEYLECRNHILALWSKDVSRILPLAECGVTDTPSLDEAPRASLIREIYAFLDQGGYINVGIASAKEKGEPGAKHNLKLVNEKNVEQNPGVTVNDLEDGVSFILGQFKSSESSLGAKNGVGTGNEVAALKNAESKEPVAPITTEFSDVSKCGELTTDDVHKTGSVDAKLPNGMVGFNVLSADQSCEIFNSRFDPVDTPELRNDLPNVQCSSNGDAGESPNLQDVVKDRRKIIVIGAGPAGLTAARHLQRQGFAVTVVEARSRIGGRVYTDRSSLSVPVDLGASIITGIEADVATERRPDPSSLICAQLGLELTVLNSDCPLYDIVTGEKVPTDLDEALEAEYNSLLDDMVLLVAQKGEHAMKMSLEDGLEYVLKRRRMAQLETSINETEMQYAAEALDDSEVDINGGVLEKRCSVEEILSPLERRIIDWHYAHLEYGCAALLKEVSLPNWNQDDVYGGFGGAHCMIKGGYSNVIESLGQGLRIHLNHVVTSISYGRKDFESSESPFNKVKVSTSNGSEFLGDAVLITIPLGCLKAETIKFSPQLPMWKHSSIQRLGFGVLNKVVMEFPEIFWDDSVDYFGATAEETDRRGHCFMFWNVRKTVGAPVLIALVVGKAAIDGQSMSASDHVNHALKVLRKLFGEASVPNPVASVVTDWGGDPFSYGAYSYVAIGSSGEDYDMLGRPVENCLFFAGEATCKEHPDTVGGAMMSGLREAVRIIDIFNTGNDYTAEVEAMEAAQRLSVCENDEVRDITRRLEAVELSNVLYKSSLDRSRIFTREALLQDLFFSAKTTAGRLHLAKKLLNLPTESLKSFAGTRKGLTNLNSWILDSMGKDGTQLLRHCVRLLVRVSTDLLAVRLSGIGKTVKEKVCVHTSRDIRAIASQLVSVWLEVFRREKASNGGLKRKSAINPTLGKPPLRTHHGTLENKGSLQTPTSSGSPLHSNVNVKKVNGKLVKLENMKDPKLESRSHASLGRLNSEEEAVHKLALSEEEQAALAAVEAAHAAARAAAEAYASSQAKCNTLLQLPKIPSFHKFARREQYSQMDEYDLNRKWSGGGLGRQDCISEIDSRNCRVMEWSVDFSAAYANHDSSRKSVDNLSQRSHSNEIACHMNLREQSGESAAVDSSLFTTAWVDTAGIKDYHAIERWQSQAAAADPDFFYPAMHVKDEEDSNTSSKPPTWKNVGRANESSISQVTINKEPSRNHPRGADQIKQAVADYVASLLMPLYKARKIDREGYKSIMKKSATKVMEKATDAEKAMAVSEFLDFKRKNKIRAFVDKLIEGHMTMKPNAKS